METLTAKYSEEALAFLTLFKAMKPEVKEEVSAMIGYEAATEKDELSADTITEASVASFHQVWDTPEDEHWDSFIKGHFHV